jgi:hypothetical protein
LLLADSFLEGPSILMIVESLENVITLFFK